jgi:acetyl esterase/lipase
MKVTCSCLIFLLIFSGCTTMPTTAIHHKNLPYVSGGGSRQQGDMYLPNAGGPHPVALVIHGGGWSGRDRTDMERISGQLVSSGYAVFNINYRLAPEHVYPAQLQDVQQALDFIQENAEAYALNPERLIAVGYSAGAQLALLASVRTDADTIPIRAVIAGGAPVDFSAYPNSPIIRKFIGGNFQSHVDLWLEASPIQYEATSFPPVFLYHGRLDALVKYNQSVRMTEKLSQAGIKTQLDTRYLYGHILTFLRSSPSIEEGILFANDVLNELPQTGSH